MVYIHKKGGYTVLKKLVLVFTFFIILAGCGQDSDIPNVTESEPKHSETNPNTTNGANPVVTITMENGKQIVMELYPDIAPNTVNNFISLINKGFYDGVIFHRVIPGFMIQGGDPQGTGMGGPDYTIKGEFTNNGFENNLSHTRGVVSMARTQVPDSAGSQFFIMVADTPQLDGEYAAFGEVTSGMETVDEIVSVERDGRDKPLEDQRIKQMTVDTFGVTYPEPEVSHLNF
ncbi:peptidylprolyl isomerase [Bacillus sp. HMF5848]|uniref:peptidylprolyl isomerase n=1 Tax=Bacillus sp. HMF5848 TaxID=2495421 RepID=UPI000F7B861D|nr:peptidylprolyl isomerase [Bacillus sp. HMF5848]